MLYQKNKADRLGEHIFPFLSLPAGELRVYMPHEVCDGQLSSFQNSETKSTSIMLETRSLQRFVERVIMTFVKPLLNLSLQDAVVRLARILSAYLEAIVRFGKRLAKFSSAMCRHVLMSTDMFLMARRKHSESFWMRSLSNASIRTPASQIDGV